MKGTFLAYERPLLTAMIQCSTPEECIQKIKKSIHVGAEAFGIQLCRLKKEYRTKEIFSTIFSACGGLPIYITSYRAGESEGLTDEACAELLLLGLDAGAVLCDVMGDLYERSPRYELAESAGAIAKQKALIAEIHRRGGEVLMSSHTYKSTSVEENIRIAKAHIERGADIIKIVNNADSREEIFKYIDAIQKIVSMTDKRLLLLVSGEGALLRYIGPCFGVCMYLCVESHGPLDTPAQPLLCDLKVIRDHLKWQ